MSSTTTAVAGPERSGIGPGLPVPNRTTSVLVARICMHSVLLVLVEIREHVRLVLIAREPVAEFFHTRGAVLADHAYEDRAPRAFRLFAANASLPGLSEDRGELVAEL